ncbi:MAG: tRNA (adenosine(37)-N6)-threonylcarbamoyltransferase complex ATPase subunit type 1 TsaE, partial [Rhodobiaceae bacterium]|nr:tRNA (adenosine(37)-N6)-threonylcarbamoyltransferase complex ATPase subunit type 1 TsaE [Rhodobiaceae bacterium]
GDIVTLTGDLGAGKSVFARGAIRWFAADPEREVASPTFSLVQVHDDLPVPVAHADFYRLEDPDEAAELGLDEIAETAIVFVEWPDRGRLPKPPEFSVAIQAAPGDARSIVITAGFDAAGRLERMRAVRDFLAGAGYAATPRLRLQGDASTRRYERLVATPPLILMDSPRQPDGPPVHDGLPYSRLAHLAEEILPFVAVGQWLAGIGLAVPEIGAFDLDKGLAVLSDLGAEPVVDADRAPVEARYAASLDCLAVLHRHAAPRSFDVDGRTHTLPAYDTDVCLTEVSLFADWFAPAAFAGFSAEDRAAFMEAWSAVLTSLDVPRPVLVLRDFHSPNLIWRDERTGTDRVGIIDFQDALCGHPAYDVVSLCQDARVTVSAALEARLLGHYRSVSPIETGAGFDGAYAVLGAQRATKILGIFVRLSRRDGKHGYLRHLPRMADYLGRNLEHPALGPVREILEAQSGGTVRAGLQSLSEQIISEAR